MKAPSGRSRPRPESHRRRRPAVTAVVRTRAGYSVGCMACTINRAAAKALRRAPHRAGRKRVLAPSRARPVRQNAILARSPARRPASLANPVPSRARPRAGLAPSLANPVPSHASPAPSRANRAPSRANLVRSRASLVPGRAGSHASPALSRARRGIVSRAHRQPLLAPRSVRSRSTMGKSRPNICKKWPSQMTAAG